MSETTAIHTDAHHSDDGGRAMRKLIWKTFWILLLITVGEIFIAFTSIPHGVLKLIFISLTIVKAYFIVGTFMHVNHERKQLRFTILLPFMLIIYFIAMLMAEGNYWHWVMNVLEGI
ncbi:MAG: cytochrome C oxidase subunit IV family protein [Bacteroidota bacterium]